MKYPGEKWIHITRRWTMVTWCFLTIGVFLGAHWAYAVLGWGGYWGWDPVENASLMPWLTGTAFLHSVMMQEKRGMLKVWNMSLIFATFLLSMLGTFLTRSGVISSVHAFAPVSYTHLDVYKRQIDDRVARALLPAKCRRSPRIGGQSRSTTRPQPRPASWRVCASTPPYTDCPGNASCRINRARHPRHRRGCSRRSIPLQRQYRAVR